MFKKTIRWAAYLLVAVALYIGVLLAHGTYTDYHPAPILPMPIQVQAAIAEISDSTLKLLTWNVGYCGDGAESTFFYDNGGFFFSGGKWVRPPQPISEKNLKGVTDLLASYPADFFLLQEVDRDS